ncbi:MAG TPA: DUF6134 family protein [Chitinophagaceae bacterium]|jgi:hypothetical protein|nr:DUF6134 family protein [Chitinophagaceae bacterium]
MIPVIVLWLIKKYKRAGSRRQFFRNILNAIQPSIYKIAGAIFFILLICFAMFAVGQTKDLTYTIMRGSDIVGGIHFTETNISGVKQMQMESQVKGKILFLSYSGSAKEEAEYQNGVLYHSSIYRKLNGKEKANKQHQAVNNEYQVRTGANSETMPIYPITYNMLSLYSTEPSNVQYVYSDNFQRFLEIKKLEEHKYKLSLPDGNTNYYYYQNGVLTLVEAHSTWYSVMIVLKK